MNCFGKLKSVEAEDASLLDLTMTLYGSNFGDANKHTRGGGGLTRPRG